VASEVSFIFIHASVWPQCTNVTDGTDRLTRQMTDSIGRTVLQTVAQKWHQHCSINFQSIFSLQQLQCNSCLMIKYMCAL